MPIQNPLSIPGGWKKDGNQDTPQKEEPNPVESQTVPRTPSGIVSESGGILDDAGRTIGKVENTETDDGKSLVGGTVTGAGEVLDKETGEVLGRASLDSQNDEGEYTTGADDKSERPLDDDQSRQGEDEQSQKSGGVSGTIKSGLNAAGSVAGSVTGGGSRKSDADTDKAPSEAPDAENLDTDKVQDTAKDAVSEAPTDTSAAQDTPDKDAQSEVPSEAGEIKLDDREQDDDTKTEVPESTAGDKSQSNLNLADKGEEVKDDVADKADDTKETVDDKVDETKDTADDTADKVDETKDDAADKAAEAKEAADDKVDETKEAADDKVDETKENVDDKTAETQENVDDKAAETKDIADDKVDETKETADDKVDETKENLDESKPDVADDAQDTAESKVDDVTDAAADTQDKAEDKADEAADAAADAEDKVEDKADEATEEVEGIKLDFSILKDGKVNKTGNIVDSNGDVVGRVVEGDPKKLQGRLVDEEGNIWSDSGKVLGKAEPLSDDEREDKKKAFAPFENFPDSVVEADGRVTSEGRQVGTVVEGDAKRLKGSKVDEDGDILDRNGNTVGRAEAWEEPEPIPEEAEAEPDRSILKGGKVNKSGNVVNDNGDVIGRVVEGEPKELQGLRTDENGNIWSDSGKILGKAEPLSDDEREKTKKSFAPFENFPDAVVEADGRVTSEGRQVGTVVEGDAKRLKGSKVDEDGDILDRNGNTVGRAEAWDEPEPIPEEAEAEPDRSILKGGKVNKTGNVVNDNGDVVGRVVEGDAKQLQGHRTDENGNIWSDSGKIIGKAEPLSDDERDKKRKSFAPFENFPDAVVEADGRVTSEGRQVGTVVEGDAKRLKGSKVDEDGDILDRNGNTVGRAEPWDEPEPEVEEPEPEVDRSILAGKRVNKAGNVVDSSGTIFGRVIEGSVSTMIGRMCDKKGNVLSESGDVIGKADLVSEGEREGSKEGPFAELSGLTVRKDGKVVTPSDEVVGRLVSGDPKKLFGRAVDEDGDVVDKNGNSLGKAERYEEPEEEVEEKKPGPYHGRKVNKEGNVVDEDGNVFAKLVSGEVLVCAGKDIDDDGDVINSKGNTVGHVALVEDIPAEPEPEPEVETESEEDRKAREQAEADRKLAGQLSGCIEQSLEKVKPICKLITDKIDKAERTPKEELDEEALVREVKPLIEEGGRLLSETNGIVRGLDPDGRIQRQAKHKSGTKEASPEEHHLAEMLKELTGDVSKTVDNAKRKIDGMPHAKKELNPLWGLLMEPLGQILAAVGLLLTGVLGLVGRLLSGLGLGGIVDGLLGGLGLKNILGSLGLGSAYDALVGKKKK